PLPYPIYALSLHDALPISRLAAAYSKLVIGNPLDEKNHVGPLIDQAAVEQYLIAIEKVKSAGGKEVVAGGVLSGDGYESGCYVKDRKSTRLNSSHVKTSYA